MKWRTVQAENTVNIVGVPDMEKDKYVPGEKQLARVILARSIREY